jgi:hypothetical protein
MAYSKAKLKKRCYENRLSGCEGDVADLRSCLMAVLKLDTVRFRVGHAVE